MRFSEAAEKLAGIPFISDEHARQIYDIVLAARPQMILELGFAHGTSTCYMAAALDEVGSGQITTMDKTLARELTPTIDDLLSKTGLGHRVEAVYCPVSYNWELMKLIERHTENGICRPIFDFCFIDGAHTWEIDGMAFFLADKLLRPGGWVLFDDLHWRHADFPSEMEKPWIKNLPEEMTTTMNIEKVFSLLVAQHPSYEELRIEGDWAWARKIEDDSSARGPSSHFLDQVYGRPSISRDAYLLMRRVAGRLLGRSRRN